jgi:Flp pilus assembly pilin Flp
MDFENRQHQARPVAVVISQLLASALARFRVTKQRRVEFEKEFGQASVEYALVLLGAAIVATVLIGWATNNNVLTGLFDFVVNTVKGKVR